VRRQPDFSTATRAEPGPLRRQLVPLACALLLLAPAVHAFRVRGEARVAAERVAQVRREVEQARARLHARTAPAGSPTLAPEDTPPARVVADVAALLPGSVRLERLAIDYRHGGALELAVVARDAAAWDELLRRLERAPRLREVVPGPEARAAEVRSLVRARVVGGAP
jgi:hypothetical protein